MRDGDDKLKLGKGVAFVKSQLRHLRQEDDTWEADFFPIPCSGGEHDSVWMGMVLSQAHDYLLAQRTVEKPPSVNDLARLLADAMQRPLAGPIHRPRCLSMRARPEWAELVPHLKQIGVQVVSQGTLPKWDRTFGDLYAQVQRVRSAHEAARTRRRLPGEVAAGAGRRPSMARSKKPAEEVSQPAGEGKVRLYTLEVFLLSGPITEKFARKNPGVSRTIQIRGDQTLVSPDVSNARNSEPSFILGSDTPQEREVARCVDDDPDRSPSPRLTGRHSNRSPAASPCPGIRSGVLASSSPTPAV
jgi:Domain of unknown function (DUF6930)